MKQMMAAVVMAAILLAISPAYCSTYYVATTGNDTSGTGSIDFPWATIGKAVGIVVAGDTIYVRAGTYSYTGSSTAITLPAKTGSSETNRCSLMGYNGERPLLDFSAMTGTSADGLKINGSYWHLKAMDLKGAPHNAIKISGGSYNIVEFCTSYENRNTGMQLGAGASYNQFINCDSYRNYDIHNSGADADGFAPKMDVGTGNYFYGCRAWQNSDDAYDGYLRGADDVSTTYENCWAFECGWSWIDGSTNSGMNGNGFKMGGCDADANGEKHLRHNVVLKNCLAFGNKAKGFDQNSDKGSMTLYNCTAFSNGGNNFSISTFPLEAGKIATVTNSVSAGTGAVSLNSLVVQVTDSWQSPFVVTNADFVSVDPAAAYGPRQADGSLPDIGFMRLAAGSDLIDGGTDVGLPYNGAAPDLGAFEYVVVNDTTAPTPNPMTFGTLPYATGSASIAMVATTASDASGVVYYFACTAGGGHDSGWQASTTYTDTGLASSTTYTYRVIARDNSANHNETGWSDEASATTMIVDLVAPTPDPMTWELYPYALGISSITMTAATASDESGVEYYFDCVSGGGHDSGWQTSPTYTDTGLAMNTTCSYAVQARDKSSNHNLTGWSATRAATTYAAGGTTRYEAENQYLYHGVVATNHLGYSGTGFVDTTNEVGSYVEWTVASGTAGSLGIGIRFSNGTTTNRPMSIMVNGVMQIASFDFGGTTNWDTWVTSSTSLNLNAGSNTIRLTSLTVNGGPNLDFIDVTVPSMDMTAPTPSPMEWAAPPAAMGSGTVAMTARTAGDAGGVEYFFANVTDPAHDSGWQDGTTYIDSGLVNNTEYTYAVMARDKSAGQNETGWSGEASATTLRYDCESPLAADLDSNCQVDFMDFALIGDAWAGDAAAWTGLAQFAADWLVCNRSPAGECWQ